MLPFNSSRYFQILLALLIHFGMNSNCSNMNTTRWSETEVELLDTMRFKLKEQLQDQIPYPDGSKPNNNLIEFIPRTCSILA